MARSEEARTSMLNILQQFLFDVDLTQDDSSTDDQGTTQRPLYLVIARRTRAGVKKDRTSMLNILQSTFFCVYVS